MSSNRRSSVGWNYCLSWDENSQYVLTYKSHLHVNSILLAVSLQIHFTGDPIKHACGIDLFYSLPEIEMCHLKVIGELGFIIQSRMDWPAVQTIKKRLIHLKEEMTPGTHVWNPLWCHACYHSPCFRVLQPEWCNYSLEQVLKSTQDAMINFQIFLPNLPALFFFNPVQKEH